MTDMCSKESILQEAQRLIYGQRAESYGSPIDNFTVIGDLWTAYLEARHPECQAGWFSITAEDVGLMMTLLKIARQAHKPGRDNLADGAGYLGCVERIEDERRRRAEEEFFKISRALRELQPKAPEDSILDVMSDDPRPMCADTDEARKHGCSRPYCPECGPSGEISGRSSDV